MTENTRLDTFKTVTNLVVAHSISWTVGNMIGNNTNASTNVRKAQVVVAAAVLGPMIADHTKPYINDKIDRAAKAIQDLRSDIKDATAN